MSASDHDITELLQAWGEGDLRARDRLMPLVYAELRRRAATQLRRERHNCTLQPTALVHEAYLRLVDQRAVWRNRAQFFAVASQLMRRLLVDRERSRRTAKRAGGWVRVPLDEPASPTLDMDILALDDALKRLAEFDPRKSQVAELRFFSGLSLAKTGEVLGISLATVERDWQVARAWLFKTLKAQS